jgi:hypothetical protein
MDRRYVIQREGKDFALCECGCGEKTPLAKNTDRRWGTVKGQPVRFVRGHARRKSPVEYVEEDRGFTSPCWIWQRARDSKGYCKPYPPELKTTQHARRRYYERVRGPVPTGLVLDHLCRVRLCVNPWHLEAVPRAINARRGKSAHLTDADVLVIKSTPVVRGSGRRLAERFNVSSALICFIRKGLRWKEVDYAALP